MRKIQIKKCLSLLTLTFVGAQLAHSAVYKCDEDSVKNFKIYLAFNPQSQLISMSLLNLPLKKAPKTSKVLASKANAFKSENAEEQNDDFTWENQVVNRFPWNYELSYTTSNQKKNSQWVTMPLDDSLVGSKVGQNGSKYGKVRLDIVAPSAFADDVGSSYFFSCEKLGPKPKAPKKKP